MRLSRALAAVLPLVCMSLVTGGCGKLLKKKQKEEAIPVSPPAEEESATAPTASAKPKASSAADSGAIVDAGAVNDGGEIVDFTGKYNSTEGFSTITQKGDKVTINYTKGIASCKAKGKRLFCTWNEGGSSYGQAQFTKTANGGMVGSWGSGSSASDGGPWSFTPVAR